MEYVYQKLFYFIIFLCPYCAMAQIEHNSNIKNNTKHHPKHKIAIAIHGGASNIKLAELSDAQQQEYKQTLSRSLDSGYAVLLRGGSAEEAVIASILILEDSPIFNAGKGSVFTNDSTIEMDAAIMCGKELKAGAVCGVQTIKNPITAAYQVMKHSKFLLLSGAGAEKFAKEQGCEIESPEYFKTEFRRKQFMKLKNTDTVQLDNDSKGFVQPIDETKSEKYGTVGCVAIDQFGNLAAGTSTGGIVNKKYNRVGDSPIIGAGTFANNQTCAISCTGKGEDFMRLVAAHDISCLMDYKHYSLSKAMDEVIQNKLKAHHGRGGCIGIDKNGNIYQSFTTSAMFRGMIDRNGLKQVAIFK